MSVRSIARRAAVHGPATPTSAPIYVDSDDNRIKYIPAGSGTTEVILQEAANKVIVPIVAFALTASQSGSDIFLGPTAGFAITLPAVAAGLRFRFTVADNFITSNYVISSAAATIIFGAADVDSTEVVADAETNINFVASAELKGDYVEVWSDGTLWFVNGRGDTSGSITFTT